MFYQEREPGHFHAEYQGQQATFLFSGELLAGEIRSGTARRLIREWAASIMASLSKLRMRGRARASGIDANGILWSGPPSIERGTIHLAFGDGRKTVTSWLGPCSNHSGMRSSSVLPRRHHLLLWRRHRRDLRQPRCEGGATTRCRHKRNGGRSRRAAAVASMIVRWSARRSRLYVLRRTGGTIRWAGRACGDVHAGGQGPTGKRLTRGGGDERSRGWRRSGFGRIHLEEGTGASLCEFGPQVRRSW
jgi:hypothetical protein